jgi:hypothetical protein
MCPSIQLVANLNDTPCDVWMDVAVVARRRKVDGSESLAKAVTLS